MLGSRRVGGSWGWVTSRGLWVNIVSGSWFLAASWRLLSLDSGRGFWSRVMPDTATIVPAVGARRAAGARWGLAIPPSGSLSLGRRSISDISPRESPTEPAPGLAGKNLEQGCLPAQQRVLSCIGAGTCRGWLLGMFLTTFLEAPPEKASKPTQEAPHKGIPPFKGISLPYRRF